MPADRAKARWSFSFLLLGAARTMPARELDCHLSCNNIGVRGTTDGRSLANAARKLVPICLLSAKSRAFMPSKFSGLHPFQPESGLGVSGKRSSLTIRVAAAPDFVTHSEE